MPTIANRGRGRRAMNEINMVPFIDVMLVLLIIFMVTAPLMTPGVIDVPRAGQSSKPPDKRVNVQIDAQGHISLTGEIKRDGITAQQAVGAIQEALKDNPAMPVMIAADRQLPYEQVIEMMKSLRETGVERVGLAVK
jgi:biopolymer transport protein TolR